MISRPNLCVGFALALIALAGGARADTPATQPAPTAVDTLKQEARASEPLVKSDSARAFLAATERLPAIAPRTLYRNSERTEYFSQAEYEALPEERRAGLTPVQVTEQIYYNTRYGTPLAYVRPLDLAAQAGLREVAGKRIMDFGCGTIGHLRLLADCGADVVGVDVDPMLRALYAAPGDQGPVAPPAGGARPAGRATLVTGQFPGDAAVRSAVGGKFDLITSKNTLKNGYLHPEKPVDPRMLVQLGVSEAEFVKAIYDALKPGGFFLIYNICPAPSPPDQPYKPWADGRCPFSRDMLEQAGFRVLEFDRDDSATIRAFARAFKWHEGPAPMDLENDLFASYTLMQKPAER